MTNTLQNLVEQAGTVSIEQFCSDNLPAIINALLTNDRTDLLTAIGNAGVAPESVDKIKATDPFIPKPIISTKRPINPPTHVRNELLPSVAQPIGLAIRIAPPEQALPEGTILELLVRRHRGKWTHPASSPNGLVSRSKFCGGGGNYSWDPVNSDMSIPVVTEWATPVSSIQFYPVQWYGGNNYRGQLTMPLKVVDWDTTNGGEN